MKLNNGHYGKKPPVVTHGHNNRHVAVATHGRYWHNTIPAGHTNSNTHTTVYSRHANTSAYSRHTVIVVISRIRTHGNAAGPCSDTNEMSSSRRRHSRTLFHTWSLANARMPPNASPTTTTSTNNNQRSNVTTSTTTWGGRWVGGWQRYLQGHNGQRTQQNNNVSPRHKAGR